MSTVERQLGGGEGTAEEGLYGSIRVKGMVDILSAMFKGRQRQSIRLMDVGAGLGRPSLLAWGVFGISTVCNVEADQATYLKLV
jgi:hypothetical protein